MATEILIIEDEPLIAMDLEALVEGLGHNVTGVEDVQGSPYWTPSTCVKARTSGV